MRIAIGKAKRKKMKKRKRKDRNLVENPSSTAVYTSIVNMNIIIKVFRITTFWNCKMSNKWQRWQRGFSKQQANMMDAFGFGWEYVIMAVIISKRCHTPSTWWKCGRRAKFVLWRLLFIINSDTTRESTHGIHSIPLSSIHFFSLVIFSWFSDLLLFLLFKLIHQSQIIYLTHAAQTK